MFVLRDKYTLKIVAGNRPGTVLTFDSIIEAKRWLAANYSMRAIDNYEYIRYEKIKDTILH